MRAPTAQGAIVEALPLRCHGNDLVGNVLALHTVDKLILNIRQRGLQCDAVAAVGT